MAKTINLPTFKDERGNLTVIEKLIDFDIKRVYYIYSADNNIRGGHRHKHTKQLLVCISGQCNIYCENQRKETHTYHLNSPELSLYLDAEDWHTMQDFTDDCILLVLASEYYDINDYIDERY